MTKEGMTITPDLQAFAVTAYGLLMRHHEPTRSSRFYVGEQLYVQLRKAGVPQEAFEGAVEADAPEQGDLIYAVCVDGVCVTRAAADEWVGSMAGAELGKAALRLLGDRDDLELPNAAEAAMASAELKRADPDTPITICVWTTVPAET
jgi:hypothetical protein